MTDAATETPQEPSQGLTAPSEAPTVSLASVMTPAALEALAKAGLSADRFAAPKPPEVRTVGFEELCTIPSKYPKASVQTAPLVYLDHRVDSEASDYAGYQGVTFIDAIEPALGRVIISHAYARTDGELLPVSEWVTAHLTRGDVFMVAAINTRAGRTVYRPIDPAGYPV